MADIEKCDNPDCIHCLERVGPIGSKSNPRLSNKKVLEKIKRDKRRPRC